MESSFVPNTPIFDTFVLALEHFPNSTKEAFAKHFSFVVAGLNNPELPMARRLTPNDYLYPLQLRQLTGTANLNPDPASL